MSAPLPKRFYDVAGVLEREDGFVVALDGKAVVTPARAPLALPTAALADAVAAEWAAQVEVIDPATMPLTRLANAAIDGVARARSEVAEDIVKYAGSDLVCYRADGPERLVERQRLSWDPVLAFARDDLGARFVLAEGVMFVDQSDETIEAVRCAIRRHDDVFTLAALHTMTTLTGSALLALGVLRGVHTVEEAWSAAHVDEDWNVELWGQDHEAQARRAARWLEMRAAALMAEFVR
ncbi:ATP12 family chaperone protein [Methylopila henanensis]|uniref:ATP12 family chaperone protein n=1 Tax=Methylopila henanensis TaxID=873516 RepID=A0ABW4K273_9HYPH